MGERDTFICKVPVSAKPIMARAPISMHIVINWLLRSLRITKGPTRWLNGEPHRQRGNLLDSPDRHKERVRCANWRRVLTSLNLVVRGRSRARASNQHAAWATRKRCASFDGAGSGYVPFFAASWKQR